MDASDDAAPAAFDIPALAAALPDAAGTMLADHYLVDRPAASARVMRIYRPVPAHFHAACDEYLYVLAGRATFWTVTAENAWEVGPGRFLFFPRRTVHAIPDIREEPFLILSVDAPRRAPRDVHFVDPAQGSPERFMQRNAQ